MEIKKDGDDSKKNAAKYRDGSRHFEELNKALEFKKLPLRYWFKFLTPMDYDALFETVRSGSFRRWKSELMISLE
jgi:hypothetical protein